MSSASEYSNLPYVTLPIAALLGLAAIPRALKTGRRVRDWYALMARAEGDLRPGPGHFPVTVAGDAPTNLGHSSESKNPSATPTLVSEPVVLQIVGGPQVRLAAGAKLNVKSLAGAKRRTVDTTTTKQGVENRVSFDVVPGARFWLECDLVMPSGDYRQGAVAEARPLGDAYVVQDTKPAAPGLFWTVVISALVTGAIGFVIAVLVSGVAREGCRGGKRPVSAAESADGGALAIVFAMLGVHLGLGFAIPPAMEKMGTPPRSG
jgi:hypothetical protein